MGGEEKVARFLPNRLPEKQGGRAEGETLLAIAGKTEVGVARFCVATAIPLRNLATHATREGVWEEKQQAALLGEEGLKGERERKERSK